MAFDDLFETDDNMDYAPPPINAKHQAQNHPQAMGYPDQSQGTDDQDQGASHEDPAGQQAPTSGASILARPQDLHEHEGEMWDTLNDFEHRAWNARNTGIKTGWKDIDDAFEGGLKTGWILIAGDSNIGKTSFLSLMAWNVAHNNNDVYVMDFSLDDPMHDKIPRVVAAANKVIINAVGTPNNYLQYPEMLKRRSEGLAKVRNAVDRYRCYDANHGTDIDIIEASIKSMKVQLEESAMMRGEEPKRLVVLIDNFHDLTTTARESMGSDKMKYDYLAQRVADMATRYDIPLITTGEFKKLNGFRRPGVDDIRESVKIKYEAKAILLCYSEVGVKGESASVYYERQGKAEKQPVFEVKFGKNKMGSEKGRAFFEFYPEIAYFELSDSNDRRKYNNLIYSND